MSLSRSDRLLDNAKAALISAIEIYNKPTFAYREETFAILALNAWELLLKAKLLEINGNKLKCLHIYSKRELAPGRMSKKEYAKRNCTGNRMTASLDECVVRLEKAATAVPEPVKKNLAALTEIRDNAIHFINASPQLAKQVMEVGTACLRNFIELGKQWLNLDLSGLSLYLMPIGFLPSGEAAAAITLSNQEQRVVNYLAMLMREGRDKEVQDYHKLSRSFDRRQPGYWPSNGLWASKGNSWINLGCMACWNVYCYQRSTCKNDGGATD